MSLKTAFSVTEKSLPELALGLTVLFTVAYFFLAHEGTYFYDDFFYSTYANQLLSGNFKFDDTPFCHRFMVFVPVALLYQTFGVSAYVTTVLPLFYTAGCLWLIYVALHRKYPVACAWALVLFGFNFFTLFLSNYLYPDNIVMFFGMAALVVLYQYRRQTKSPIINALLFGFINFLAMLSKETIVYLVPFYLYVAIVDFSQRKHIKFWLWSAVFGGLLLAAYFLAYEIYSGHFLNRFILSSEVVNEFKPGYLEDTGGYLLKRLTYQPVLFFIGSGLMVQVLFAIPAFRVERLHKTLRLQSDLSFWLLVTFLIVFQFWFGSTSYTHYKPMVLLARMCSILMPPLCIVAGFGLQQAFFNRKWQLFFGVAFVLAGIISQSTMAAIYVPAGLYFLLCFWRPQVANPVTGMLVVAFSLGIRPLHFMVKPTVTAFFQEQDIILNRLNKNIGKFQVVADTFTVRQHPYMYRYKTNPNYTFTEYTTAKTNPLKTRSDTTYLLINSALLQNPELIPAFKTRPDSIKILFPDRKLLLEKGQVQLFYLPEE